MKKLNPNSLFLIIWWIILAVLWIKFWYSIAQECIPSICDSGFCTADCGWDRSYFFPITMMVFSVIFIIIGWINIKNKK